MREKNKGDKRVSIVEVAKLAGVSQATAARVFDKKWDGKVRESTREQVMQAASALGYRGPNALARSIQGGPSGIVALVVGSTTGYFYAEVIMKFVRKLQATHKQVLIFEADPQQGLAKVITQICCYQVDAIIVTAAATTSAIIEQFCDTNIPVVAFNRQATPGICSAVYCDGSKAAAQAAEFMLDQGLRNFLVISGETNLSKELGRVKGFCSRVLQRGGRIVDVVDGDYLYESGYDLFSQRDSICDIDGVFCVEDTIAMGVIDAAKERFHLRVPDDLSVMGFDNTSVGRFHAYSLTTMAYPINEMIDATIEVVESMIQDATIRIQREFDMRLVQRGSVRLLPVHD